MPTAQAGLIAYTSNRGGHYDIWLFNPIDGRNVKLTNGLGTSFTVPEWSPDSSKIAFVGENGIIFVINVSTGALARIDQLVEGSDFSLDWSPDSEKVGYTKQDEIVLYNVLTHQFKKIRQQGATDVQWFPSGQEILFQAPDTNGVSQIYQMRVDGTGKRQITNNTNGPLHDVLLSPDGAFVLFTSPGASISLIHTVELATGNIFGIEGGPLAKNFNPMWSPDSTLILYSATADGNAGYNSQIRTVRRTGENDRIWASSSCFSTPVTWSPDGRRIAYLSGCTEQEFADEIWVLDLRNPRPMKILDGVSIISLRWSPTPVMDATTTRTYKNQVYKVSFQYPAGWQKVTDERYEGTDGFFQIAAISAGNDIGEVCRNEAFHQLMPYGSMPHIFRTRIQGQEACIIIPSLDQPPEMKHQAAMIVRYPRPVVVNGATYNYFILWVDLQHINELASTFRFLA